jgi:predicted HicB family RNase H-like nuclease
MNGIVIQQESEEDDMDNKPQEVIRVAQSLFHQNPDWVTFFREVLGLGGIVRQMYPSAEALTEFEKTAQYGEIQQMLAKLRVEGPPVPEDKEPTRVITVRLPKSLHEFLQVEAHEKCTSMNQLCISKLVQWLDSDLAASKTGGSNGQASGSKPHVQVHRHEHQHQPAQPAGFGM